MTKVYLTARVAAPSCFYVNRTRTLACGYDVLHVYGIVTRPKFTTCVDVSGPAPAILDCKVWPLRALKCEQATGVWGHGPPGN